MNANSLNTSGTNVVEKDTLILSYKFMGALDKTTELKYVIVGDTLELSGDVTLLGTGSMTVKYTCEQGGVNWIQIILIGVEVLVSIIIIAVLLFDANPLKSLQRKTFALESVSNIAFRATNSSKFKFENINIDDEDQFEDDDDFTIKDEDCKESKSSFFC